MSAYMSRRCGDSERVAMDYAKKQGKDMVTTIACFAGEPPGHHHHHHLLHLQDHAKRMRNRRMRLTVRILQVLGNDCAPTV